MSACVSASKPIIGLSGAPGAGKTAVACILRDLGCVVLDADAMAKDALEAPDLKSQIFEKWGHAAFWADGKPNREWIAKKIFTNLGERSWLESLIHPAVNARRAHARYQAFMQKNVVAIVEDCPLLFEKGLDAECDATVFVDAPLAVRQRRVHAARNWSADELCLRENAQWSLDIKRSRSDHVLVNDAGLDDLRKQTAETLRVILERFKL